MSDGKKRVLRWVPGKPCNGVTYYMHAFQGTTKFSLAKAFVGGVEKYSLWKDDTPHGVFNERLAALNHAETLL